jgi:hypothetical protein
MAAVNVLNRQPGVKVAIPLVSLVPLGGPPEHRLGRTTIAAPVAVSNSSGSRTTQFNMNVPVVSARGSLVVEARQAGGVPAVPPSFVPKWFKDDSSWTAIDSSAIKRVLSVEFVTGATLAQKQAAIDSVQGTVIGGSPWVTEPNEGAYYIGVPNATTLVQLMAAITILQRQSSVLAAVPLLRGRHAGGGPMNVPVVSARGSLVVEATQSGGLPAVIVDSTPGWIRADSSYDQTYGGFLRGVLGVSFKPGTSLSLKQAALDSVMGIYVGGMPGGSGWDGVYYIRVADDGTSAQLQAAIVVLMRQSQVLTASLVFRLAPASSVHSAASITP